MSRPYRRVLRFLVLIVVTILFTVLGSIPVQIAITKIQVPEPQAIFMLGGDFSRDRATAELGKKHPNLSIWLSGVYGGTRKIFVETNIDPSRIHYDDRATDTVTNFTTMIKPLQAKQIRHVYLVTSDYHMRRSLMIATIVFGSRGMIVTPVPVPSQREEETLLRAIRDLGRSIVWLFTGRTGASLKGRFNTATTGSYFLAQIKADSVMNPSSSRWRTIDDFTAKIE